MKCTAAPKSHVSDWNFIFILMQIYRLRCENVETNWINSASKQIQNVGKTFPGSNNMSSIQITVLIDILLFIALWLMPTSLWNKKWQKIEMLHILQLLKSVVCLFDITIIYIAKQAQQQKQQMHTSPFLKPQSQTIIIWWI